jgi:hypothetical protein
LRRWGVLVLKRVVRRFKKKLLRWLLDPEVLKEVSIPILRIGEGTINIDGSSITFPGLTADPTLASGKLWFRSDLSRLVFSPDGTTTKQIAYLDDVTGGTVSRSQLEYLTENVELVYLTAIGKTEGTAVPGTSYPVGIVTIDSFTDKTIEVFATGTTTKLMYALLARSPDQYNTYAQWIDTGQATADHRIVYIYYYANTAPLYTYLATESVDISALYPIKTWITISGSTITSYRLYQGTTYSISATDTNIASGRWGIGYARDSRSEVSGDVRALSAKLLPPASPIMPSRAIIEVEYTCYDYVCVPSLQKEEVEVDPTIFPKDVADALLYNERGSNGKPLVDRLAVSWGAFEPNPKHPTNIIMVYGPNPYNSRAVEAQKEHCMRRGNKVFRAPRDYNEAVDWYRQLIRTTNFQHWIAGKDNFAYQALGHEEFELFQVADFYYGFLIEHRKRPQLDQIKRVPDWELRRTIEMWIKRLERVTALTNERDKHIWKLRQVLKLGW